MVGKKLFNVIVIKCVILIVGLLFFIPGFWSSSSTSFAAEMKTLTIGSIWDLTGTGADIEGVMQKGEALCKDYINANGGIVVNGQHYQVNIIGLDGQSTTAASVTAAQQLVYQKKVSFVIGQTTPNEVEAIRSVTDPNKVLYIAGCDDTPSAKFPYTISAIYPYKWPKTAEYDYLVKTYPNVKTVAVLNQDEAGNMASGAEAIVQIKKHGLTLGKHMIYPFNTTDYLPIVTKLVATKPDAIDMCLNMPSNAAMIVKDARQLGFTGPILGGSPWDPKMELEQIGAQYATDFIWPTVDPTEKDAQSQIPALMAKVMKLWNDTYHVPFVLDSLQGWNPLWVLKQAIENAQSLDPTAVARDFAHMTAIETAYGAAKVGGQQTYGINAVVVGNVPLTRLQNGKAQFLGWFPLEIP
jgi:branched-chain amino acid transport system substrate-binding protein